MFLADQVDDVAFRVDSWTFIGGYWLSKLPGIFLLNLGLFEGLAYWLFHLTLADRVPLIHQSH